ncbi:unnamed protein product [Cochlearia groenlandica]
MLMTKTMSAITTTAKTDSDFDHLVSIALNSANANTVDGVKRCFATLRCLRDFNLSSEDLYHNKAIIALESLRDHGNPKIKMGANVLFTSWIKTLYSHGRQVATTCNKTVPLILNKKDQIFSDVSEDTKQKTESLTKKQTLPVPTKVSQKPKCCPSLKSVKNRYVSSKLGLMMQDKKSDSVQILPNLKKRKQDDERFVASVETKKTKHDLNKSDYGFKSFETKPVLAKKQSALPMKLSENPSKPVSKTTRPLQMNKKQPPAEDSVKVSQNPKAKHCPALRKNSTEMLELFEVAKKSADVANTKGLLLSKAETSICVDTLSLLKGFPIVSTATETRKIMNRLLYLTKYKDRKICNSASALFQHWSQSIKDQQSQESINKTRKQTT